MFGDDAFFQGKSLGQLAKLILAYVLIFVLLLANNLSIPFMHLEGIKIYTFLVAIFYWSVFRPSLLPAVVVFFAGLSCDVLWGEPLGLNALFFLILQRLIIRQRRFLMGQAFMMIWFGFVLYLGAFALAKTAFFSLINMSLVLSDTFLISVVLSIGIFPLIHVCLRQTHKIISDTAI